MALTFSTARQGYGQKPRAPKKAAAPAPNVTKQFREGRDLFDKGKYADATKVFNRILKKFPTHQPTIILYGRALYKLGKLKDAYYLFSRANPQLLTPDAAYEYGQVFYARKQYAPALVAFRKVPSNHPFSDLSNYYAGVCALKLKKFKLAATLMEKALVLPEKEAKARTLYLKHINKLQELKQKQRLKKEFQKEQKRLKQAGRTKAGTPKKGATKPETPDPPAEYGHDGFLTLAPSASLHAAFQTQELDYHGIKNEKATIQDYGFSFGGGPYGALPGQSGDRRSVAGLPINVTVSGNESDGEIVRTYTEDTSNEIVRILRTSNDGNFSYGEFSVEPFFEIPVARDLWLGMKATYFLTLPNLKRDESEGSRGAKFLLGRKWQGYVLKAEASFDEFINATSEPQYNRIQGSAYLNVPATETFSYWFKAEFENYDYQEKVDGPDTSIRLTTQGTLSMPLGSSLSAKGVYDYQVGYRNHVVPSYDGALDADASRLTGQLALSVAPVDWISLSISGLVQKTQWSFSGPVYSENPELEEQFRGDEPDFILENEAKLTFNLLY